MMNYIISWAKSIIYCGILLKIMNGFVSDTKLSSYLKFVSNILIIMVVISPLIALFQKQEDIKGSILENVFEINQYAMGNQQDLYSGINDQLSIKLYKKKVKRQIEEVVDSNDFKIKHVDVAVNSDASSDDYGGIERITVDISFNDIKNNQQNGKTQKASKEALAVYYEKIIKNKLIDFYKLKHSNIYVNVEN